MVLNFQWNIDQIIYSLFHQSSQGDISHINSFISDDEEISRLPKYGSKHIN